MAAVALAAGAALSGCSSSSTPPPPPSSVPKVKAADDIQILNALVLGKDGLNNAFGVDAPHAWQTWTPSDLQKKKIGLGGFASCKFGLSTDGLTEPLAETYFRTDDGSATTPTATATATSTSPSGKRSSPSPTATFDPNSAVPNQWVGSVAAVYADAGTAKSAAKNLARLDPSHPECASPGSVTPGVSYVLGPVEANPTWYGQNAVYVFVDTKQGATMTALAQQRGRFVIVTYTKGSSKVDGGYYTLNNTTDATNAASAATTLLSQLTNAVVSGG